jgi:hypothetical protein
MEAVVPDDIQAEPGTSDGPNAVPGETDEERDEAGAREQGVRTEKSRDLSSPRLTVRENDSEAH